MALTCKHGTRNDGEQCWNCNQESGETVITQLLKSAEITICQWCQEPIGNFVNHSLCRKAYQQGQKWAIQAIRQQTWLMCHRAYDIADWLEETIKNDKQ